MKHSIERIEITWDSKDRPLIAIDYRDEGPPVSGAMVLSSVGPKRPKPVAARRRPNRPSKGKAA